MSRFLQIFDQSLHLGVTQTRPSNSIIRVPRAFASDTLALALAQEAVAARADLTLPPEERVFMYMPYTHSESRVIHEVAERFFKECAPETLRGNGRRELKASLAY